jgi:hypothetical protein
MALQRLLVQRKTAITGRWLQLILDAYPPETSRLLRQNCDRFANPVGYTVSRGIEHLYQGLLEGADPEKLSPALDSIVRIRAVQDWSPSEAVGFVYLLKRSVREELGGDVRGRLSVELSEFESLIDRLALLAFDISAACRERIFEIRVREVKAGSPWSRKTDRDGTPTCRIRNPEGGTPCRR